MKGQYMLVFTKAGKKIFPTWHKTEADALQYIMDMPVDDWVLIGIGDDGTQRFPNEHLIIIRRKS